MSKKQTLEAEDRAAESPVETQDRTTAVTTHEGGVPAEISNISDAYEADAGAGLDGMGASDLAMPFLTILQKGSPQVDETDKRFVDGARPGMIFNTVTGDLYDGKAGLPAVACGYQKLLTEWTPREQGGGFKGHHTEDSPAFKSSKVDDKNKRHLPSGNLLIDTAYYFLLVVPDSGPFQAMVAMTSTQLKKSRKWNSLMKGIMLKTKSGKIFNPPMYSHVYLMKTEPESNDQGSWYGWSISTLRLQDDHDLREVAKKFNEQIKSGVVRTGPPPSEEAAQTATGDVPF